MTKKREFPLPRGAFPLPYPQTPQSASSLIKLHGLCVAEISRVTGIDRYTFVDLLSGRQKGVRGNAHRAAILLGLKPEPQLAAASLRLPAERQGARATSKARASERQSGGHPSQRQEATA